MNSIEDRLDTLESVVDEQQAQIEAHEETIAAQQATIEAQRERLAAVENDSGVSMPMSRRGALAAGGALGLLGLGAGTASASTPSGQVGTADRPLKTVHTESVEASQFLDFTLGVYDSRGLRIDGTWDPASIVGGNETNEISSGGSVIGGGASNEISGSNSVIGGGQDNNVQTFNFGTISGGRDNTVNGTYSTIGGGHANSVVDATYATIAGGGGAEDTGNTVSADYATVGGGQQNEASGSHSTVAGGGGGGDSGNHAAGDYSSIPGGSNNRADGDYSFAVGQAAEVKEDHDGAFIVGDSSGDLIESTRPDQARFQMNVGADAFELVEIREDPEESELEIGEGMIYINNDGILMFAYKQGKDNLKIVPLEPQ